MFTVHCLNSWKASWKARSEPKHPKSITYSRFPEVFFWSSLSPLIFCISVCTCMDCVCECCETNRNKLERFTPYRIRNYTVSVWTTGYTIPKLQISICFILFSDQFSLCEAGGRRDYRKVVVNSKEKKRKKKATLSHIKWAMNSKSYPTLFHRFGNHI